MFDIFFPYWYLGQFIDGKIPRQIIQIGKYEYRIIYREGDVLRKLEKRRVGIFGRWQPIFSDTYENCIKELKSRADDLKKETKLKSNKIIYALIKPKDLE
jgi:hypothetical protein